MRSGSGESQTSERRSRAMIYLLAEILPMDEKQLKHLTACIEEAHAEMMASDNDEKAFAYNEGFFDALQAVKKYVTGDEGGIV